MVLMVCGNVGIGIPSVAQAQSKYNDDPFTKPGIITPLTLPDSWPVNIHRNPHNLSPDDASTKLVVLGTGMPLPNPYRSGPGYALVVNGYPYLVDAGEGIWRSIARAALVNGDEFTRGLSPEKLKYFVRNPPPRRPYRRDSVVTPKSVQTKYPYFQGNLWPNRNSGNG